MFWLYGTHVQLYSVQQLCRVSSRQKVLTDPQSESDRREDQNIVSPRTQILQTEVTMMETRWPAVSASPSYWYISTIMNSVLQLAFLVCGMDLILIIYFDFICNYFIFPSLYKYWHCSCPQCIIGFPSLSPSSELQLFLSNLTGWQYYIWVSELSLSRLIMENIQLFSQY